MLVFAILSLLLAIVAVRSGTVTLGEIASASEEHYTKFDDRIQAKRSHTLILLSRQGTQAVVTCFRGARLGFSDCGCMVISRFVELVRQQRENTPGCGGRVKGDKFNEEGEKKKASGHPTSTEGSRTACMV